MITQTSLNHPTVQQNLYVALHRTARLSKRDGQQGRVYLKNSKGERYMRIEHTRGIGGGFTFYSGNKDLKKKVLTSLRENLNINAVFK